MPPTAVTQAHFTEPRASEQKSRLPVHTWLARGKPQPEMYCRSENHEVASRCHYSFLNILQQPPSPWVQLAALNKVCRNTWGWGRWWGFSFWVSVFRTLYLCIKLSKRPKCWPLWSLDGRIVVGCFPPFYCFTFYKFSTVNVIKISMISICPLSHRLKEHDIFTES